MRCVCVRGTLSNAFLAYVVGPLPSAPSVFPASCHLCTPIKELIPNYESRLLGSTGDRDDDDVPS